MLAAILRPLGIQPPRASFLRILTTTILVAALHALNELFVANRAAIHPAVRTPFCIIGRIAISLLWPRMYNHLSPPRLRLKAMDLAIGLVLQPLLLLSCEGTVFLAMIWLGWCATRDFWLGDEMTVDGLWLQGGLGLIVPVVVGAVLGTTLPSTLETAVLRLAVLELVVGWTMAVRWVVEGLVEFGRME